MKNSESKIIKRQSEQKSELLELLKKVPIVQVACEKLGIGRATYYRWHKDDEEFALKADEAIQNGKHFINDMAESQLISEIKEKNMTAIIFWLKHNHPTYGNRLEVTTHQGKPIDELDDEQKELLEKALSMGGLENINLDDNNDERPL